MDFELTTGQKNAVSALERALNRCHKENVFIKNLYGTLTAYDGNVVEDLSFEPSDYCLNDRGNAGYPIKSDYDFDSYADDCNMHFLHLKDGETK